MLTDPALDAGRHEFELRTLLGRVLPPEENLKHIREHGLDPAVREIYPLIIGGMSFGALSPNMWKGCRWGWHYLNEELGMPVRMSTGEGGCRRGCCARASSSTSSCRSPAATSAGTRSCTPSPIYEGGPLRDRDQIRAGAKPGDGGAAHVVQRSTV